MGGHRHMRKSSPGSHPELRLTNLAETRTSKELVRETLQQLCYR